MVRSGRNSNLSEIFCMSSLPASIIRAVAGQRSSPKSGFANKTKFFSEQKIKDRNHWTMKYRMLPASIIRAVAGQRSLPESGFANKTKMFFRAKIERITGPWNIGHCDLNLFWDQRSYYTDSFSKSMTFIHQILFKIKGKITGPWNIGHSDLHLFRGQMSCHTDS